MTPLFVYAIVVRQHFRVLQRLTLALLLGQSVAGDELLGFSKNATPGSRKVVDRLPVVITTETTDGFAEFVARLRISIHY